MQTSEHINRAFQTRDAKAYETLTTTDFVRIGSNGRVFGRTDWFKVVAAPGAERGPGRYDEVSVRVFGNGAVVTYRNGVGGGRSLVAAVTWTAGNNRSLKVLARKGGQWQQVLQQSSPIVKAKTSH